MVVTTRKTPITDAEIDEMIRASERCDVCRGEKIVAYIQAKGGFSEPAVCYKCNGIGRKWPKLKNA